MEKQTLLIITYAKSLNVFDRVWQYTVEKCIQFKYNKKYSCIENICIKKVFQVG